ncbi:MAG: hypothetical protein M0028_01890 [Clostridia bacterium]|nr:hypothetical protein [Clostridia bacterium]
MCTPSRTGVSANVSRTLRRREKGGAQGSIRLLSTSSALVMDTATETDAFSASATRASASRTIRSLLVQTTTGFACFRSGQCSPGNLIVFLGGLVTVCYTAKVDQLTFPTAPGAFLVQNLRRVHLYEYLFLEVGRVVVAEVPM